MKNRKTLKTSLLAILLSGFCLTTSLAQTETTSTAVCLHLQFNSPQVIAIIPANTTLEILNIQSGWYNVNYNGQNGWVLLSSTSTAAPSTSSNEAATAPIVQQTSQVSYSWSLDGVNFTSTGVQSDYPEAYRSNLTFQDNNQYGAASKLHPVFADRLNELAKHLGGTITITSGFRSIQDQVRVIKQVYNPNEHTLDTKTGRLIEKSTGKTRAAKPGSSDHQRGLAVDISKSGIDAQIRNMSNADLQKFGLCKPLSNEPWHLEAIL